MLSKARALRLFTEEVGGYRRHVRCVDKRRVCVERGVYLRYCVYASFGQDARVIAGPHPTTALRQMAILFILITVCLPGPIGKA